MDLSLPLSPSFFREMCSGNGKLSAEVYLHVKPQRLGVVSREGLEGRASRLPSLGVSRVHTRHTHTMHAWIRACVHTLARERNAESRGLHSDANSPLRRSFSSLFLLLAPAVSSPASCRSTRPVTDKSWGQ